jgi:hypothetical protein
MQEGGLSFFLVFSRAIAIGLYVNTSRGLVQDLKALLLLNMRPQ